MLESKHKGRYEYRKLSLLLLHTDTYRNARTSSFISRKSTSVNDLWKTETELKDKYSWNSET